MAETVKPKNPNALLLAFRKYHGWLGLGLTAFILTVALTGIYLNHKDLFKGGPGEETRKAAGPHPTSAGPGALTTATDLNALPVTFAQALAACRDRLGEQPVERIELKNEKGRLVYKVKTASGEVSVDASSGAAREKKADDRETAAILPLAEPEKEAKGAADWGKLIKDVHTGKVGGLAGKLLVDLTAGVLIVLSLTGVYLWLVPRLRKRRSARQRSSARAELPEGVALK